MEVLFLYLELILLGGSSVDFTAQSFRADYLRHDYNIKIVLSHGKNILVFLVLKAIRSLEYSRLVSANSFNRESSACCQNSLWIFKKIN